MEDIVARLRELDLEDGYYKAGEAADEIERLRAEVERLRAGGCARDQRTTQYCAEAEALRRNGDGMVEEVRRLLDRAENAEAENAKLREALQRFAGIKASDGDWLIKYDPRTIIRCEVTVADLLAARAALDAQEGEHG